MNLTKQLLKINQKMIELAEKAEWQLLKEKTVTRHGLVEQLFAAEQDTVNIEDLKLLQQAIVESDKHINQLIKTSKAFSIKENIDLKSAQTAVTAYRTTRNNTTTL